MSRSLEEYSSLREVYKEASAKSKKEVEGQNWFVKNLLNPLLLPLISKQIGIPYHDLRKKTKRTSSRCYVSFSCILASVTSLLREGN